MLEHLIWSELYQQIPKQLNYNNQQVGIEVYRAKQFVKKFKFPAIFVDFLPAVIDKTNTPLNEIFKAVENQNGDIEYTKGVVLRQSIDMSIYDNDVQRIADLQNQLWLWAKKDLKLTDVVIVDVLPPKVLDFVEEDFVYRRNIEIICRFTMTWQEIVTTIERVETSLNVF